MTEMGREGGRKRQTDRLHYGCKGVMLVLQKRFKQ